MSLGTGVDLPAGYEVLDLPASPALPLSFARAALRAAGVGGGSRELPRVAYRLTGVRPDPAHVARYADVVGGPRAGRLPLLYPNALSFPLQMALMTAPGFPFAVIGMVHLENTVRQGRGLVAGTALDLEVRAENLRPHRLGQVLDVVTVVRQGGHVAWTQVGTFLRRRPAVRPTPRCTGSAPGRSTPGSAGPTPRPRATATRSTCTR
ncbi:hypothetical protein [Kineosporia sp. A_224]|uniref:hypothetical protein n=1 Tax=Kineosporia sp. A_224 TaxID=1962180 RepID=UPI001E431A63|nr:hypothetical protein [Kineosporia sp. A_224]